MHLKILFHKYRPFCEDNDLDIWRPLRWNHKKRIPNDNDLPTPDVEILISQT